MTKELIYDNPLNCERALEGFVLEGSAVMTFPQGRLRLENRLDPSLKQKANYVLWCPQEFPSDIAVEWDFWPVRQPGLAILFFAARGKNGEDLFDLSLQPRTGEYPLYHHGDINAFHISNIRRKEPAERAFPTCTLRTSYGFYMAAQGGDPIPDVGEAVGPYHLEVIKRGTEVGFSVNGLEVLHYHDDWETFGPLLGGGKIGFRQLAPMIGEYANLKVFWINEK